MATRAKLLIAAGLGALLGAGCYRPSIADNGLLCAADDVCPEGFHCAATGLCKKGPRMVCEASMPPVAAICEPDQLNDCDPICQSRCECGRCTLVAGTVLTCMPAGTKQRGEICNASSDDCAPGNICRKDCSEPVWRCARFCRNGDSVKDVCDGQECGINLFDPTGVPTGINVCEAPFQACNPVGDSGDCGHSGLGCYVSNSSMGATVCDCKGTAQPGATCTVFNSCIPGYRCVTLATSSTCLKTCRVGVAGDCPSGACMSAGGGSYGYCPP
jgi:hypothetical protein